MGVACAALLLAGCRDGGGPPPPARPFADPGFVEAANWRLHYALTPTLDLPSAIAGSYGIEQRDNLALLTITFAARGGAAPPVFDGATAEATAVSLTGHRAPLPLRRTAERGEPTWLATVVVRDREPVTIEIRARAAAAEPELRARWTREFPVD